MPGAERRAARQIDAGVPRSPRARARSRYRNGFGPRSELDLGDQAAAQQRLGQHRATRSRLATPALPSASRTSIQPCAGPYGASAPARRSLPRLADARRASHRRRRRERDRGGDAQRRLEDAEPQRRRDPAHYYARRHADSVAVTLTMPGAATGFDARRLDGQRRSLQARGDSAWASRRSDTAPKAMRTRSASGASMRSQRRRRRSRRRAPAPARADRSAGRGDRCRSALLAPPPPAGRGAPPACAASPRRWCATGREPRPAECSSPR